ncbi:MAG TPA: hypothetical protein VM937_09675 [Burkholderiaceae bacterium]|jgi:hypothetical protein|nr:hypothetical protein [Burkholderiaceae bacterium]
MTRILAVLALGAASLTTGCIVVPLNADGTYAYPAGVAPYVPATQPVPTSQTLPVRLYPINQAATASGMIAGSVTNHLNGRGTFTLNVGDETMSGEATRSGGSGARTGVANAYGARGSYANCRYTMNTITQGTGSCTFSNGGQYQLHIGT